MVNKKYYMNWSRHKIDKWLWITFSWWIRFSAMKRFYRLQQSIYLTINDTNIGKEYTPRFLLQSHLTNNIDIQRFVPQDRKRILSECEWISRHEHHPEYWAHMLGSFFPNSTSYWILTEYYAIDFFCVQTDNIFVFDWIWKMNGIHVSMIIGWKPKLKSMSQTIRDIELENSFEMEKYPSWQHNKRFSCRFYGLFSSVASTHFDPVLSFNL